MRMWIPSDNLQGVAIHNWDGDVNYGLALDVGDFVDILEECGKWYRGTCTRKPRLVGLFPKSYIHIKDLAKTDPVVAECTQVLREWSEIWKKLFVERETYKFQTLRKVMFSLLESRRELLGATLTLDQTLELQLKVISKIDWGNRKLCLDLVPRIGPLAVDPYKIGAVSLHNVHVNSAENAKASSSRGTLRRKTTKKILTHHLYFCMRDFGHRIGDDAEIYFYLYDGHISKMRQISERFLVKMPKDGFSNYVATLHSNCSIFSDLGESELNTDLYLVACVMRVGKILAENVKKSCGVSSYRRPYGVGVLQLTDMAPYDSTSEPEEKEHSFKIFTCEEKDFHQLHEFIIKKTTGKFSPINASGQGYGLVVSLKILHGGLSQARLEQPLLFQGTTITRKMGFADVIMPGDVRNDLFLTMERAEFERGGKSTAKNIEVGVYIFDSTGTILNECLWGASGMDSLSYYRSMIIYHNNSPAWNESLRLSIPIDKFSSAHVRFEFRHCSTRDKSEPKLFGFSFARLMEPDGATLADGNHELYVYKCEDPSKLLKAGYLMLPCSAGDDQSQNENSAIFNRTIKETFIVKSVLCSTKLTQNGDLLSLLQWRNHPEKIQDSLTRVLRLRDEELVKFLQDVLDALFAMFSTEDGNSTEHSGLVFHVLVSIFSLLQQNKFQHFKPVIDAYIENHFAAALVYKGLLSSVQHCAEWMTSAERPEPIQKCFGSLEYIMKLIIQSRKLFSEATDGQFEDSFKRDLQNVFISLNGMLIVASFDAILPTQEALLNSTGVVMEQMVNTLPPDEIAMLVENMLDSVPREAHVKLIQAKLKAIKDLVSGKLFQSEDTRSRVLRISCKHLRQHLAKREELKLCAEILGEILINLHPIPDIQKEHDLNELSKNILTILIQTVMNCLEGSSQVLCSIIAVLLGLLQQLDESHYRTLWDDMSINGESKDLKDFLHHSLLVFKELLSQDWQVFPNDWLVMKMCANDIIRRALEEFAKPLVYRFLGPHSFDSQLWWSYFSLAVTFLTQPSLQLEQYHEAKRRKILHNYGDMRELMGFQILSMWSQLGEHKLHFIPSMVGPFLEVTLVPGQALRKATLTVFFDMMQCEQASRGSFRLVESELIDKLDLLISENKGDDEYRELFSTILLERVEAENPTWRESGISFISSVTQLLERLLDYRSVMQGDENRDKRMSCTVNLLNFYKNEINRKEMYLRYIYKLHDLHLSAENYTEAGFTLKLYADMLSWESESLTFAPMDNNGMPEWHRKEKLYHEIIRYFDKGKCWEKGVSLCKELANLYEIKRFDYNRLSEILITEAKFFQNILTQIRPEPEYFRVGFFGLGFPLFVRNKQFVYRGLEYERLSDFTRRLQNEFPQAQILTKNSPPDTSILQSPEQYIQISSVRPISDLQYLKTATTVVPDKIARFYEVNDVIRFVHDRPIHKGPVDKENEFKSLWIERTTVEIAEQLPNILRWFEIKQKAVRELTPVEFACETMENVRKELSDFIVQYKSDENKNLNPFTMRLQGVIDANVQGGISKYQEAFFTDTYMRSPEGRDQISNVQRLKHLILDQMQVLETALNLHGRLAPQKMQPLQERLIERFKQLRENLVCLEKMKRQTSDIVNTPLPPLPHQMSLPVHKSTSHYEPDDIYTPVVSGDSAKSHLNGLGGGNRETLTLPDFGVVEPAPPVPSRHRSTGYIYTNSPEVPPKRDSNAPPLPPRGYTPDKRTMFIFGEPNEPPTNAPNLPKRRVPYSVVDISLDDSELDFQPAQQDKEKTYEEVQKRDSGISNSSGNLHHSDINGGADTNSNSLPHQIHTHTYPLVTHSHSHLHHSHLPQNIRGHHKTSSNPEVLAQIAQMTNDFIEMTVTTIQTSTIVRTQINSNENLENVPSDPPPIPPKNIGVPPNETYFDDDCSSTSSFPLPPIPQKSQESDETEDQLVAMYDNFRAINNSNGNNIEDDCSTCEESDDGKVIIC